MNKKLEKLYRYCKANGYDESCETFESDLNQLLIQQVEGDELSMVAGGRSATKTLAATLISVLSIASPFASANQNGTSRNISTKNAFSVSPSKNAPSNKKSRMDLLKNILLKGVLPVAGLGTVGICLEELIRRKPWEKKDTKPANQTSEKVLQKQKEQHQAKEEKPNADEQTKKEQEKEGDRTLQSLGQDTKEKEKEEQERLKQQEEQRLAEEAKRNLEKLVQSMFYKNCFSMDFAKIATAWQNQVSPINLANACVQELLKRNNNNIFDTARKLDYAKRSYYRKSLDLMEWNRIFTPGSSLLGCQSQLGQIRRFSALFFIEISNIFDYDLRKKLSPEEKIRLDEQARLVEEQRLAENQRRWQEEQRRLPEEAKRNFEKLVQSMFYENCFSMDFAKIATAWQNQVSPINLANACVQELLKRNNNNIFDTVQKLNDAKRSYYRKSLDLMEWNRIFTPGSSLLGCQSQLGQIRWFASLFDEEIDNILKYDLWKKLSPEEYSEIFFKHN